MSLSTAPTVRTHDANAQTIPGSMYVLGRTNHAGKIHGHHRPFSE